MASQGPATPDAGVRGTVTDAPVPAVELRDITKAFPGVLANDRISLRSMSGEVLCLLGENGAGKSTLMSILSGLYQPDSGTIRVDGDPVRIDSPRAGRELGIGMVYQHLSLIPTLSILENLMLGSREGLVLDARLARERLAGIAGMLGVSIDPDVRVSSLALGQQQHVEIIKALWKGSRVLILDEPTSMLTPQGIADLQQVLLALKSNGIAIIFITHKLHEAIAIGDRITILRQGRVVGAIEPEVMRSASPADLRRRIVSIMFGEAASAVAGIAELASDVERIAHQRHVTDDLMLELVGVSAKGAGGQYGVEDISLRVNKGEILGIAGVDGNGQRALAEVIAGQRRSSAGLIRVAGNDVTALDVSQRQRLGLRYVTDDRLGEGVVARYSLGLNLVLKRIGEAPYWHRGRIDRQAIAATANELIAEFDIRTPSAETPIGRLSGGNIQKSLLARELSFGPRVVVFNKPTYGLDVRTIATVRERIRRLAAGGVATIVISTDLDELVDLCDRVAVLFAGRIAGIVPNGPGAEHRIGELIIGGEATKAAEAAA